MALPGVCELMPAPCSLSEDDDDDDDDDDCAVMSLSDVLLSCSRSGLRRAAASLFCLRMRMRSFCSRLRWPRTRTRPFACRSWHRFFLAAMVALGVSLSECERRDFLPVAAVSPATTAPVPRARLPSSADDCVSESPR